MTLTSTPAASYLFPPGIETRHIRCPHKRSWSWSTFSILKLVVVVIVVAMHITSRRKTRILAITVSSFSFVEINQLSQHRRLLPTIPLLVGTVKACAVLQTSLQSIGQD